MMNYTDAERRARLAEIRDNWQGCGEERDFLISEIDRLNEVLKFYSKKANYTPFDVNKNFAEGFGTFDTQESAVSDDNGKKARQALGEE